MRNAIFVIGAALVLYLATRRRAVVEIGEVEVVPGPADLNARHPSQEPWAMLMPDPGANPAPTYRLLPLTPLH